MDMTHIRRVNKTLFFYKYPYKGYKEIKMKSLSQSEYGELRDLYSSVYAPKEDTILEGFTDEDLDLTDEEIEEQVEEFFLECIEEGYDIDEIERVICEAVDAELEVLNEVTSPAKVAVARMKDKASGGDKPKMNVSKQKVGGSSEKKASTLSRVKSAASKVKSGLKTAGKAVQGTVGVTARAVGTAQRAASAVKGAAKKGYERGRYGSSGKPSSSSSSSGSGSSSDSSSSGSPSSGSSSSSSSGSSSSGSSSSSGGGGSSSGGSSAAPKKRKDGLLKRGLKKLVRGIGKGVSTAAGAVKAGADYVTDRARKEELEATGLFSEKEIEAIMEAEMIDENRAAARAAGGYKDDSKKQTDPSKPGFTGISGSIKDIMRQNKEIEASKKK